MTPDTLPSMNWAQAVEAMRRGCHVQRKSEQFRKLIRPADKDADDLAVYECGVAPLRLAVAWTDEGAPVRVFQDTGCKMMIEPDDEHTAATDWVIVWEPGK